AKNTLYRDKCHVYLVDVAQAEKLMKELSAGNTSQAQLSALKAKYPDSDQTLGEFEAISRRGGSNDKKLSDCWNESVCHRQCDYTDEMMASRGHGNSMNFPSLFPQKNWITQ